MDDPLALLETETAEPGSTIHDSHSAIRQRKTVLYIEDNLSNLKLIERIMGHRPAINLIAAMQGSLGIDLAREHLPNLILLDLHLPDILGDKVLHHLQTNPDNPTYSSHYD